MPALLWIFVLALVACACVAGIYLLAKAFVAWLIALAVGALTMLVTWIAYALGAALLGWMGWSHWQRRAAEAARLRAESAAATAACPHCAAGARLCGHGSPASQCDRIGCVHGPKIDAEFQDDPAPSKDG